MDLSTLTWPEARDAIRNASLAILPVGAIEQHGPHLPLSTDWLIASRIASDAARAGDRLLVPGIPIGVSAEHRQFWGTLAVEPDGLRDQAISIARSLSSHGLQRLVFVNGHGGNVVPLQETASRLREEGIYAFVFNWWVSIARMLSDLFPDPTAHAGSIETSLLLAIAPDLVRHDRLDDADAATAWGSTVEGVLVGADALDFTERGNVGDPHLSTAEKGKTVLEAADSSLGRFCDWFTKRTDEELAARPHLP